MTVLLVRNMRNCHKGPYRNKSCSLHINTFKKYFILWKGDPGNCFALDYLNEISTYYGRQQNN